MTSSDPSVQLDHTPGHIKHDGHNLTGFVIFLCSESIIFLAFFAGFSLFKLTSPEWLPAGVDGLEVKMPLINTIVLVSSSFVAYFAERYLHKGNLWGFRIVWFITMLMGAYFVYGQYVEWSSLKFGLDSGVWRHVLSAHWIPRPACDHRHRLDGLNAVPLLPAWKL